MEAFAKSYGFRFICHAPKHSDRKAGEERSFLTVETNFLPGRTFESLADLNRQALEWSTVRMEQRPQGKPGLIPAQAFEYERGFLQQLPRICPRLTSSWSAASMNTLRGRRGQLLLGAGHRAGRGDGLALRPAPGDLPSPAND